MDNEWEDPDYGPDEDPDYGPDDEDDTMFADPGGRSALRAATTTHCFSCRKRIGHRDDFCKHCGSRLNPRKYPCPNCGTKNTLTPADLELKYQCNACADQTERGF